MIVPQSGTRDCFAIASLVTHTFLHREEGNSSHITDTAYWLVRPLYSVYSLIAKLQDP